MTIEDDIRDCAANGEFWEGITDSNGVPKESIDAHVLSALLFNGKIHARGLHIQNAIIDGDLDLDDLVRNDTPDGHLPPLSLINCRFGRVYLRNARIRRLNLDNSHADQITADDLRLGGDLDASKLTLEEGLYARFARIEGSVKVENVGPPSHSEAANEWPVISFRGARVEGGFSGNGSRLSKLELHTSEIAESCHLRSVSNESRFHVRGETLLIGARIGGQLSCNGAKFENPNDYALSADQLTVHRGAFFVSTAESRFEATGEIRLLGAHIGGQLAYTGAKLENPDGLVLNADGLTVESEVLFTSIPEERFVTMGEIRLLDSRIGGQLNYSGAKLENSSALALTLEGIVINGGIVLSSKYPFLTEVSGTIHIGLATIYKGIQANGLVLTGQDSNKIALNLHNSQVLGDINFSSDDLLPTKIFGDIKFDKAKITGNLFLKKMYIGPRYQNRGASLSLKYATIENMLETKDFRDCNGTQGAHPEGIFDLRGAHVDTLSDHPYYGWPTEEGLLKLDRFTYRRLAVQETERHKVWANSRRRLRRWLTERWLDIRYPPHPNSWEARRYQRLYSDRDAFDRGGPRDPDAPNNTRPTPRSLADRRLAWLRLQYRGPKPRPQDFKPQPYIQLAKVLRETGHDEEANKVIVEKRKFQRQSKVDHWFKRLLDAILGCVAKYGYGPGRASLITAGYFAAGIVLAYCAAAYELLYTDHGFIGWVYGIDAALPVVDLGQISDYGIRADLGWTGHALRGLELAYRLGGLAIVSILVLTLTGLLKRE